MKSQFGLRRILVALLTGVLVGGGLLAVTPAGAQVSSAAATSWKKIWKKNLRPLADKRYYTKAQTDAKYQPKGAYEAAGSGYTKAESDARYAGAGSSYTKAESDAKYAPAQALYRGTIMLQGNSTVSGPGQATGVSFGATFATAPTPHYIKIGDAIPAGCSGTAAAPNAAPGHFCVFETEAVGVGANRGICRGGPASCGVTDPFGAGIYATTAGSGVWEVLASWAARPTAVVNPAFAPAPSGAVNTGSGSSTLASRD